MSTRERRLFSVLFALILLQLYVGSAFMVIMPGVTLPLHAIVEVPGSNPGSRGTFFLTSVANERANLLSVFYSFISPERELITLRGELPPGMNLPQYMDLMGRMMEESIMVSQAVAFQKAGLPVDIRPSVRVEGILPRSPAAGILQAGDEIIGVDGQRITTTEGVMALLQNRTPGEVVVLEILREGENLEVEMETVDERGQAALRIMVGNHHRYGFPCSVKVEPQNIGGSSAGLMFALEILDQLTPQDLTKGWPIAGTGTLTLEGRVEAIGGVKQKVIAAERAGARYFFAPQANVADARRVARDIQIVGVETIEEALTFLENLPPKT
ncbi:MAG: PDZ domain-containing protein [Limnochordia bacterium]|jgi:PDZ domain-containing protein